MSALTGNAIQNIYKGFIHLATNLGLTATITKWEDGEGNDLGVESSTTVLKFTKPVSMDTVPNATSNTNKIMVLDGSDVKYRTAAELLDDIGAIDPTGEIDDAINALKDGVATEGDTLAKLYTLILGIKIKVTVADIAARNALDVTLPLDVFVLDDGDGKWALYQATTSGVGATFVKISDQDGFGSAMTGSQIKVAYEGEADTNAFTDALKTKLENIEDNADVTDATNIASSIVGAVERVTLSDTDLIAILNSDDDDSLNNVPIDTLKSYLKTYFDTIYPPI